MSNGAYRFDLETHIDQFYAEFPNMQDTTLFLNREEFDNLSPQRAKKHLEHTLVTVGLKSDNDWQYLFPDATKDFDAYKQNLLDIISGNAAICVGQTNNRDGDERFFIIPQHPRHQDKKTETAIFIRERLKDNLLSGDALHKLSFYHETGHALTIQPIKRQSAINAFTERGFENGADAYGTIRLLQDTEIENAKDIIEFFAHHRSLQTATFGSLEYYTAPSIMQDIHANAEDLTALSPQQAAEQATVIAAYNSITQEQAAATKKNFVFSESIFTGKGLFKKILNERTAAMLSDHYKQIIMDGIHSVEAIGKDDWVDQETRTKIKNNLKGTLSSFTV